MGQEKLVVYILQSALIYLSKFHKPLLSNETDTD